VLVSCAEITDSDWHGLNGATVKREPVKIGNHVWICTKALILKGVTIGDNAIVGGLRRYQRCLQQYAVAGNPAKQIKKTTGYTR
jgi:acetyltransferase-like isoleucine patch superfamily enzyme